MLVKSILRYFVYFMLSLAVIVNILAFNHANKFTNFSSTPSAEKQTTFSLLLAGINKTRPKNKQTPSWPYEVVNLKSDIDLEAWHIPVDSSIGTVILFHGYGSKKSALLDEAKAFLNMGFNTFLVDFRGHGGSTGNNSTIGYKEANDVCAAYDYVLKLKEQNVILYGQSMGASAILKAVGDRLIEPKCIILECPFGSLLQASINRFKKMGLPPHPFAELLVFWGGIQNGFNAFDLNPTKYAQNVTVPTLLMYGLEDKRVIKQETDAIFNNLKGPKELKLFPKIGHKPYIEKYPLIWKETILGFFAHQKLK